MAFASHKFDPRWGLMGTCISPTSPMVNRALVALESASTEVSIRGFVAQVSAKLVYCNDTNEALQVQAVFPVDEGAAVYHCEAHLDGRTIVTHCMEKKKAEQVFKEAVAAGKTAVLAREHRDTSDILTLNLGNLPAGMKVEMTLRLVMELQVQTNGGISFVLPSVLNPRYSPNDQTLQHNESDILEPLDERIVHVQRAYTIDVKVQVSGSHQIARVISHTDPVNVTLADDALSAQVSQDGGFKCDHDWSMLVYYNNAYQPHLLRETGDRAATAIMKDDLLMLNLFPEVPANTYSSKNEIIFVIDRSGSMQGTNIQNARTTLLLFLKSLPAGCLFNVVSFGNTFSLLFPEGSRIYNKETLDAACFLQASMEADMGGTEILRPLQSIYSKAPFPDYSRQILLITDGQVWNVDAVLQLVGRHAHETRVFSVGIGHGASTALVRGTARAGRGRSEMVVQQGVLQQKVMGLVSCMVQENVQDVTISCELEPPSRLTLVPKVPPVIFGGQHLILYARVPPDTQVKSITVRGQLGTKAVMNVLEGRHITVVHDEAKSLHRLAARAQIQQWQLDEAEDVAEDMVALSVASGVVSCRTALVGVDQESGKPIADCEEAVTSGEINAGFGSRLFQKSEMRTKRNLFLCAAQSVGSALRAAPTFGRAAPTPSFKFGSAAPARAVPAFAAPACAAPAFAAPACIPQGGAQFGNSGAPAFGFGVRENLEYLSAGIQNDGPPDKSPSGLMEVVGLQKFDGSWNLKEAAQLTGVPLDALCATNPAKGEAAWATALVLVLLERKFGDQIDQWMLLAIKANTFIAGCGEQVEQLLAKARLTLDSK